MGFSSELTFSTELSLTNLSCTLFLTLPLAPGVVSKRQLPAVQIILTSGWTTGTALSPCLRRSWGVEEGNEVDLIWGCCQADTLLLHPPLLIRKKWKIFWSQLNRIFWNGRFFKISLNINVDHFGELVVWNKNTVRCEMVEIRTRTLVSGRIDVYNDSPNEIGAGWLRFIGPFFQPWPWRPLSKI